MRWKTSVANTFTMQTAFVPDMALLKPTEARIRKGDGPAHYRGNYQSGP